jgi:hypothetical protein
VFWLIPFSDPRCKQPVKSHLPLFTDVIDPNCEFPVTMALLSPFFHIDKIGQGN